MSDFKAKMQQVRFRLGLRPRPRWGTLQRSPDPVAGFKKPTSKGRQERERSGKGGDGRGGKVGEKRGGVGRGEEKRREGKGRGRGSGMRGPQAGRCQGPRAGKRRAWRGAKSYAWIYMIFVIKGRSWPSLSAISF